MPRQSPIVLISTLLAGIALLASCGGGSSPAPSAPNPTPTTTVAPAPTPTPTPAPTPDPNPTIGLSPGPVSSYFVKLWKITRAGETFVDSFEPDDDGTLWVRNGDFIVFDSTQKNGSRELCEVHDYPPTWNIDDPAGALEPRDSSNAFLLRADVVGHGVVRISATVDGVTSNEVVIWSRAP